MSNQCTSAQGQSMPVPVAVEVAEFVWQSFDLTHKEALASLFEGWLCSDLTDGIESTDRRKMWLLYQDLTRLLDLREQYSLSRTLSR